MQTAAGIGRILGLPKVQVNYTYCEWMSTKLFDDEQLHSLMLSRANKGEKYTIEEIEKDYLGGVQIDRETVCNGFEEAILYHPEGSKTVKARSKRIIDHLISKFDTLEEERTLHIVVTHGFQLHYFSSMHGGEGHHPDYCAKTAVAIRRSDSFRRDIIFDCCSAHVSQK